MDKDAVIEIVRIAFSGLTVLGGCIGLMKVSNAKNKYPRSSEYEKQLDTQIRVFATICVIGLALFNNITSTYIVSIFIVATLITALEFLERLAAIILDRKYVFDYYTKRYEIDLSKANPKDVREKIEEDVKEEAKDIDQKEGQEQSTGSVNLESAIQRHENFVSVALEVLHENASKLGFQRIENEQTIQFSDKKLIIDAIATTVLGKVIVEVKASKSLKVLQNGAEQLDRMSKYYELWCVERGLEPPTVIPLLIAPDLPKARQTVRQIPIMLIDVENKVITNIDRISEYLDGKRESLTDDDTTSNE